MFYPKEQAYTFFFFYCCFIKTWFSYPQWHQTYWDLFDWSPEKNHKQHTVSPPAASPHPTEWLSSVRPSHRERQLNTELELNQRSVTSPLTNCKNTRLLGVAGRTPHCSYGSCQLLDQMLSSHHHTCIIFQIIIKTASTTTDQPLTALAKCGLLIISQQMHLTWILDLLPVVSIQVFTDTSFLSTWQSNGFY